MRFSLRWLFVATLIIAVSVVALLRANPHWAGVLRTVIVVLLGIGVVGSVACKGANRFFWIGFATVGWVHFLAAVLDYFPPFKFEADDGPAKWLHSKIVTYVSYELAGDIPRGTVITIKSGVGQFIGFPLWPYFRAVYHCVLTLLVAILGGFAGVWFYSRRNPRLIRADRVSENATGDLRGTTG